MNRSISQLGQTSIQQDEPLSPEALKAFMAIGCRLMVQLAEGCVRGVTAVTDRSPAEIEMAAENVLGRIERNARDMLAGQGVDPDGEQWATLWAVMERRYRERLAELMVEAGYRGTRLVQ